MISKLAEVGSKCNEYLSLLKYYHYHSVYEKIIMWRKIGAFMICYQIGRWDYAIHKKVPTLKLPYNEGKQLAKRINAQGYLFETQ